MRPEHTRELLESLFGMVPGLDDAASWLHELSRGSPQACMQYAQYLVDRGIARHDGGRWQLPPKLSEHGLPATLAAMLKARIAGLSADARALALGLALARDGSRSSWQPEIHAETQDGETVDWSAAEPVAASGSGPIRQVCDGDASFVPLWLMDRAEGHPLLSGVALIAVRAAAPKVARDELVQAISRCLRAAGDSVAIAIEA